MSDSTSDNTANTNLVKNALEYYDAHFSENMKLFHRIAKAPSFDDKPSDLAEPRMSLYDKNDKLILSASYQLLGVYYNSYNLFIWSWALPNIDKNQILLSKKILNYALNMSNDDLLLNIIKTQLITSRIRLSKLTLDLHIALASYLTKISMIFPQKHVIDNKDENNYMIYYYAFNDVKYE
jgi:hypothetical protein